MLPKRSTAERYNPLILVDAHQDIAYNYVCFGRDYRQHALYKRRTEADYPLSATWPRATLGLPDALLGRVAIAFATLFVVPDRRNFMRVNYPQPSYKTARQAYKLALDQLDYYHALADHDDRVRLVRTQAELDAVLATWAPGTEFADHKQGLVLLMEGADPILEPKQFEEWYERGVRVVGPAWSATRYSGGTGAPGGLTALGEGLLEHLAHFNAILDLSHMAETAAFTALDRYEGVVIASHSNPRKFNDSDRQLSDLMIRRIAEHDGVIGIVLYNPYLSDRWSAGDPPVSMGTVTGAIDYICQLTGSAAHVGIGSDFDGGFGAGSVPAGMDTIMDLGKIGGALAERGYSPADIEAIMGGNMLRSLRRALPKG